MQKCGYWIVTPLTGEECPKSSNISNHARADMSARGFWINGQTAFCDARVFNPLTRCHLHHIFQLFIKIMKHGSGTWIFHTTCFFKFCRECSLFLWLTAENLTNWRKEPKSKISAWIKARLNVALIPSMLLCCMGNKNTLKRW